MFDDVKKTKHKDLVSLVVSGIVTIMCANTTYVRVEWDSSPVNDMLADSVVSLILQLESNPATDVLIRKFLVLLLI